VEYLKREERKDLHKKSLQPRQIALLCEEDIHQFQLAMVFAADKPADAVLL